MCQTTPVRIKNVRGHEAKVSGGRKVNVALIAKPRKGDWLLVNANLALNKITDKEAREILKLTKKNYDQ